MTASTTDAGWDCDAVEIDDVSDDSFVEPVVPLRFVGCLDSDEFDADEGCISDADAPLGRLEAFGETRGKEGRPALGIPAVGPTFAIPLIEAVAKRAV